MSLFVETWHDLCCTIYLICILWMSSRLIWYRTQLKLAMIWLTVVLVSSLRWTNCIASYSLFFASKMLSFKQLFTSGIGAYFSARTHGLTNRQQINPICTGGAHSERTPINIYSSFLNKWSHLPVFSWILIFFLCRHDCKNFFLKI